MREDYFSTSEEGAAAFEAAQDRPAYGLEMDRDDVRRDLQAAPWEPDPYEGACGGCGGRVRPRDGGACLWRGGVWHPACRRRDPEWLARFA